MTTPSPDRLAASPDEPRLPPLPLWVPALNLGPGEAKAILQHLLGLDPADRYLRFGHAAGDVQIERYVAALDFARDDIFGVCNRRLELVALAHLAYADRDEAEFGVSVSAHLRGMGFGRRLFEHAALLARNRGVSLLRIHALSENQAMLRIAHSAGAQVERSGPDAEALLRLPAASTASRLEAWLESSAAQLNYSVRQQAQRLERVRSPRGEAK
ncbi:MAG: GNAT family N-acetyltransferase [Rubrivivax sp.]|nr:GNAT family N-acetyltransferase [Rubrivivax sp.]